MLAFKYIEDHIKSVLKSTSAKNYFLSSKPVFANTLSHFSKTISPFYSKSSLYLT